MTKTKGESWGRGVGPEHDTTLQKWSENSMTNEATSGGALAARGSGHQSVMHGGGRELGKEL